MRNGRIRMIIPNGINETARVQIIKLGYRKMRAYNNKRNFYRIMFSPLFVRWRFVESEE